MQHRIAVIALGGNALVRDENHEFASQIKNASRAAKDIPTLISKGYNTVITRGNGPQVGAGLIRQQSAARLVPTLPLDACVAETQGSIGYIIQNALEEQLLKKGMNHRVVTIGTRALIDRRVLSKSPRKPVGPYHSKQELFLAKKTRPSAEFRFFRGHGYRLLVPSPEPKSILEADLVKGMLGENYIPIACGGGGIPVTKVGSRLVGVEAVVDKDLASGLLASAIGADIFVSLTDVEGAYLNYETRKKIMLKDVALGEMERHYSKGEFPEGSMGPKVLACLNFLKRGGERAIIAHIGKLQLAFERKAGTQIHI